MKIFRKLFPFFPKRFSKKFQKPMKHFFCFGKTSLEKLNFILQKLQIWQLIKIGKFFKSKQKKKLKTKKIKIFQNTKNFSKTQNR
jgi:hypothetical protein